MGPNPESTPGCPQCGTAMLAEEHAGLQIDRCPRCGGVWFDRGELETYVLAHDQGIEEAGVGHERSGGFEGGGAATLRCPRCTGRGLETGRFRDVEVRRCAECGGVFLARDALLAIAARHGIGSVVADVGVEAALAAPDIPEAFWEGIVEFVGALFSGL